MNCPTAQTSLLETAAAASRVSEAEPATLGLDTTLQLVPSQCRVSVCSEKLVSANPTAQMSVAETAVTPFRKPTCFGALTRRQLVPFQCSMSGGVAVLTFPTAQTSLVETAATPRRASFELALGLATTLQAVPFQWRVRVCWLVSPTAQTSLAETLATPLRSLTDPGLGLDTTLQAAACATAGARSRAISTAPTRHEKRWTFIRFMILLSIFCSPREQVTMR